MTSAVPIVDYLVLDDEPHLVAHACTSCQTHFFDRRNACAACGSAAGFVDETLPSTGTLRTYTIVSFAAPGVPAPYVAAIVDLGSTMVRANLRNVEPDPSKLHPGMAVRLVTYSIGVDEDGTDAIGFGFEPA